MTVLIIDNQAEFYAERLAEAVPEMTFDAAVDLDQAIALAPDAEVLVGLAPYLKPELLAKMPKLTWIQALTTGVDNLLSLKGVAITNCSGIHGPQMSELAVLHMLALLRRFPRMLENQKAHVWERWPQPLLAGKTACIVGLGAIAGHLAGVLGAFGMRVTGVSGGRRSAPGIDKVYPRSALVDAAAEADFLIVLTPYSEATHHIVNAEVLGAMKPSAYLVNIARGGCVDEAALAESLKSGGIAGAALDVFAHSPLVPEAAVWDLPNLIVTPHIGGASDIYHEQALPIVIANMKAFASGGVAALKGRLDT